MGEDIIREREGGEKGREEWNFMVKSETNGNAGRVTIQYSREIQCEAGKYWRRKTKGNV